MKTVRALLYLSDKKNTSEGCESVVIAGTRYGCIKLMKCDELLCCKSF